MPVATEHTCGHWSDGGYCGAPQPRRYLPGYRCPRHTPAALKGRPEVAPDPALTINGLRAAAGAPPLRHAPRPPAPQASEPQPTPMPATRNGYHRNAPSFAELATQQARAQG